MPRRTASLLAPLTLILLAAPALATHGGIHPTFRAESVYFHCTGPTKVYNVNWFAGGGPAPWDTNAPTQSYTQGAGCGSLDTFFYGTANDNPYDAVFQGTFTGNLRDITVRLHNLLLGRARAESQTPLGVRLLIDGEPYLPGAYGTRVNVTPVLSSTGLSEYLEFSVTGLGSATEILDDQGNVIDVATTGLATEDGDGTTQHEILLTITPFFTPLINAFVWDATEIASGIVFNPATLANAKVQATLPDEG